MDSVEMPHFRQRSFLPSQPVRRTPILHNFLHILSSRSSGAQGGGEQPRTIGEGGVGDAVGDSPAIPPPILYSHHERVPSYPGCTQHLGMVCLCSRCTANRSPSLGGEGSSLSLSNPRATPELQQPAHPSTFSSARTEPRQPSERPSAFTSVYYSAGASLHRAVPGGHHLANQPLSQQLPSSHEPPTSGRLTGPDWTRSLLNMRESGVGGSGGGGSVGAMAGGMLPPRTSSSSSVSLVSVLRQQDSSSHPPVYTSATEGRGFPLPGADPGASGAGHRGGMGGGGVAGTSSGHHPFWDGARGNPATFRNVLQCNLSRYFMEFDRMQDMESPLGGAGGDGSEEPSQELLNNNIDPERPGPSSSSSPTIIHYQPPLPPPPSHSLENNPPAAGGSAASRGHLNRCRACHNLLTFNHDSQRWERTSQASSTLEPSPSASSFSSSQWQDEENRRAAAEAQTQERRGMPPVPSEQQQPPTGGGGAVAFPIASSNSQAGEQTVGLVYNQETGQWERVYRQAASGRSADPSPEALSQEMPVDNQDEDSLRR